MGGFELSRKGVHENPHLKRLRYWRADSDERFRDGFRYVKSAPKDFALLFKWSGPMVMDRCFLPLSAAFLDDTGKILSIMDMEPEPHSRTPLRTYSPEGGGHSYVLEVPSGGFDSLGVREGDVLVWDDRYIYPSAPSESGQFSLSIPVQSREMSVVSLPSKGLDHDLWDLESGDDEPMMRPEVQRQIVGSLYTEMERSGLSNPEKWVVRMLLIGSSATNQFSKTSDVDISLFVDYGILREEVSFLKDEPDEKIRQKLIEILKKLNGFKITGTRHAVNYHLCSDTEEDLRLFDSVYDVYSGKWVKPPVMVPAGFDPKYSFPEEYRLACRVAGILDLLFGKLRRLVQRASDLFDKKPDTEELPEEITRTVSELSGVVNRIFKLYSKIVSERRDAFRENRSRELEGYITSPNWSSENIVYKWLEQWGYSDICQKIQKSWERGKDDESKVKALKRVFKIAADTQMGFTFRDSGLPPQQQNDPKNIEGLPDADSRVRMSLSDVRSAIAGIASGVLSKLGDAWPNRTSVLKSVYTAILYFIQKHVSDNPDIFGNAPVVEMEGDMTSTYRIRLSRLHGDDAVVYLNLSRVSPSNREVSPSDVIIESVSPRDAGPSMLFQAFRGSGGIPAALASDVFDRDCLFVGRDIVNPDFRDNFSSALITREGLEHLPRVLDNAGIGRIYYAGSRVPEDALNELYRHGFVDVSPETEPFRVFCRGILSGRMLRAQVDGRGRNPGKLSFITKLINASCIIRVIEGATHWTGSGFKINDKDIITCFHVVEGRIGGENIKIDCAFSSGPFESVTITNGGSDIDLAVISLSGSSSYLEVEPLPIVVSSSVFPGDEVYSCGSPEGIRSIVTRGVISSLGKRITGIEKAETFFIDAEIHPGSSGGPVVSYELGGVVGVSRGSIGSQDKNDWLNYCLSSKTVSSFLERENITYLKV